MATKSSAKTTTRASTKKSGCSGCGCGCGSKKKENMSKTVESGTEMCSRSRASRTCSSASKSKASKTTKSSAC